MDDPIEVPPPQNNHQDIIKSISQEVIEEKEGIIQRILKQLKASLNTTNLLTQQLQDLKTKINEIELQPLREQGFVRQDNNRYFVVLDITRIVTQGHGTIRFDSNVEIVMKEERDSSMLQKINSIQEGYSNSVKQCELLLKALDEKQEIQNTRDLMLTQKEEKEIQLRKVLIQKQSRQTGFLAKIKSIQQQLSKTIEEKEKKETQYLQLIAKQEKEGKQMMQNYLAEKVQRQATLEAQVAAVQKKLQQNYLAEKVQRQATLEAQIAAVQRKLQQKSTSYQQQLDKNEVRIAQLLKQLTQKEDHLSLLTNRHKDLQQAFQISLSKAAENKQLSALELQKRSEREVELLGTISRLQQSSSVLQKKNEEMMLENEVRKKIEQNLIKEQNNSRNSERKTKKQQTLLKTIEVKDALYHTLKEKLEKKQKIVSEKEIHILELTKELSKYEAPGDKPQEIDYRQLQEQLQTLELELDQQKRERALEKAEWKEDLNKLRQEVQQLKSDHQCQQENILYLQTQNEKLSLQNKRLKEFAAHYLREQDYLKMINPYNEVRTTNQNLIKRQQQQRSIQSPHQFLPRIINSAQHFNIDNRLKQQERVGFIPVEEKEEDIDNIFDKIQERSSDSPLEEEKICGAGVGNGLAESPERDEKNMFEHLKIETDDRNKKEAEHNQHTNQSFPEARTDAKQENEVRPFEIKEETKKEEKIEVKDNNKEPKKQHRYHSKGERCMRPTKPDKPGKHRKILRINY